MSRQSSPNIIYLATGHADFWSWIRRAVEHELERMAEAITGEALASGEEIQALIEDVGALAANPQSVLSYPRFFQVWGRL